MELIQKIPITPIDLQKQRIKKVFDAVLILRENSVEYILKFDADEPQTEDEELMKDDNQWKLVHNSFHITAAKSCISGVEKSYQPRTKAWLVSIFVKGFSQDIRCYFKKEEDAEALRQRLDTYLFEGIKLDYGTSGNGQRPN